MPPSPASHIRPGGILGLRWGGGGVAPLPPGHTWRQRQTIDDCRMHAIPAAEMGFSHRPYILQCYYVTRAPRPSSGWTSWSPYECVLMPRVAPPHPNWYTLQSKKDTSSNAAPARISTEVATQTATNPTTPSTLDTIGSTLATPLRGVQVPLHLLVLHK